MVDNALVQASAETRRRWNARYAETEQPWDTQQTPPEVIAFWDSGVLPSRGLALDLGCGPGTNVRFLARRGLRAIGVEIAAPALLTAQRRLQREEPELSGHLAFVCADVCLLPFRNLNAVYILDIGCFHSIAPPLRDAYVASVLGNLTLGGYYQLYAFDAEPDRVAESGPVGLGPDEVVRRFTPHLTLVQEMRAKPERRPCRWYLLRRDG